MSESESTCWTVIRGAAAGRPEEREELARRYMGVVRAYLGSRWRGSALGEEVEDATQAVFVECFRKGGVLDVAAAGRVPSFRAFLYGVVRNVARRFESRPVKGVELVSDVLGDEESQSRLFDRAWARSLMVEAAERQRERARERGEEAMRRVELLRLRFEEGLAIREIAERWGVEAAGVHRAYAVAREEFRAALLEVVGFHAPGTPGEVEREAAEVLKALA